MMNINSAIFVPQGVPPPPILSTMPHVLAFMPPPAPPPRPTNMTGILQRIHHVQQQQQQQQMLHGQRHQQMMYQQYFQQQQQHQQHRMHQQQQLHMQQQQQQQQIYIRQQQRLRTQRNVPNRTSHRMQEIQQIHQQQRFQQCVQNKLIRKRYVRSMSFDEWSNIAQMRVHQSQQMVENKPDLGDEDDEEEVIEQIFSTKDEYKAFLHEKEQKYRVAEEQLQNEQKLKFQNYFQTLPQNGTKRQPLVAKYDNKKVKMQQNVAIRQYGKLKPFIFSTKLKLTHTHTYSSSLRCQLQSCFQII